jgi:DNA-directed RNA polymerase sigma subunit (sigma70/sigma32)
MKGKYAAAAWVNRFAPLSLDKDIDTRDGTIRLLDVVADHDAIDPADALETTRAKALVATALLALTPMERHVIQARHSRRR